MKDMKLYKYLFFAFLFALISCKKDEEYNDSLAKEQLDILAQSNKDLKEQLESLKNIGNPRAISSDDEVNVAINQVFNINYLIEPWVLQDSRVTIKSLDESVVVVNKDNSLLAKKEGSCEIVISLDNLKTTTKVNVYTNYFSLKDGIKILNDVVYYTREYDSKYQDYFYDFAIANKGYVIDLETVYSINSFTWDLNCLYCLNFGTFTSKSENIEGEYIIHKYDPTEWDNDSFEYFDRIDKKTYFLSALDNDAKLKVEKNEDNYYTFSLKGKFAVTGFMGINPDEIYDLDFSSKVKVIDMTDTFSFD